MITGSIWRAGVVAGVLGLTLPGSTRASVVSFSGTVNDLYSQSGDDLVVIGTFAPGESPRTVLNRYADPAWNFDVGLYTASVRNGYFRPIGNGVTVMPTGYHTGTFAGSVDSTGSDGLQLYLWVFDRSTPANSLTFAWLTGSDSTWSVPFGGSTSINASTAYTYYVGNRGPDGTVNLNVAPFPEPASLGSLAVSIVLAGRRARRKRVTA